MPNKDNSNLYFGRAAQLLVVSEFLMHNWNAAIPEVDTGDDVFVVKDKIGEFKRIQVKAVHGVIRKYGYSAKFTLPYTQAITPITPELVYFLYVRLSKEWGRYLIIERTELHKHLDPNTIGTYNQKKDTVQLYFALHKTKIMCKKVDFKIHESDWSLFPDQ